MRINTARYVVTDAGDVFDMDTAETALFGDYSVAIATVRQLTTGARRESWVWIS